MMMELMILADKQFYNPPPESTLDLNMRVIDPAWQSIKNNQMSVKNSDLEKYFITTDDGSVYVNVNYLLTQLDFITRDIRLSNYDEKDLKVVRWYLSFAGDCASANLPRAFNHCIQKVAVFSETSQGRKGFLRKIINTFYSEQKQTINDPGRKSFFTGKTKGE
jgi:hypothetical protein